jgi:citrate lyase gamma subunit
MVTRYPLQVIIAGDEFGNRIRQIVESNLSAQGCEIAGVSVLDARKFALNRVSKLLQCCRGLNAIKRSGACGGIKEIAG